MPKRNEMLHAVEDQYNNRKHRGKVRYNMVVVKVELHAFHWCRTYTK